MTNLNSNNTSQNTTNKAEKKIISNTSNVEKNTNASKDATDKALNYVTGEYRSSSSHKFHNNDKDVSDEC